MRVCRVCMRGTIKEFAHAIPFEKGSFGGKPRSRKATELKT